jgi:hypothetical protein
VDRHRIRGLRHRQRFPGQRRFVALQSGDAQQPQVGRDDGPQVQVDQVTRYQVGHVHRSWLGPADHHHLVMDLRMQGFGGFLGPVLVHEPQPDR